MIKRKLKPFHRIISIVFTILFISRIFLLVEHLNNSYALTIIFVDIFTLLYLLGIILYFLALFPLFDLVLIFFGCLGHIVLFEFYQIGLSVIEVLFFIYLSKWWYKWKKGNRENQ